MAPSESNGNWATIFFGSSESEVLSAEGGGCAKSGQYSVKLGNHHHVAIPDHGNRGRNTTVEIENKKNEKKEQNNSVKLGKSTLGGAGGW